MLFELGVSAAPGFNWLCALKTSHVGFTQKHKSHNFHIFLTFNQFDN